MRRIAERIYLAIIFIFMYAPIAALIVLSFNSSKSRAKWGGFTFGWYANLISDEAVRDALINTLIIAVLATLFSTLIGTFTCIAMKGMKRRYRTVIMGVTNIPMINADIVTGISLMILFRALHMSSGFATVLLAHITFDIPFVMASVMPRMKEINESVIHIHGDADEVFPIKNIEKCIVVNNKAEEIVAGIYKLFAHLEKEDKFPPLEEYKWQNISGKLNDILKG